MDFSFTSPRHERGSARWTLVTPLFRHCCVCYTRHCERPGVVVDWGHERLPSLSIGLEAIGVLLHVLAQVGFQSGNCMAQSIRTTGIVMASMLRMSSHGAVRRHPKKCVLQHSCWCASASEKQTVESPPASIASSYAECRWQRGALAAVVNKIVRVALSESEFGEAHEIVCRWRVPSTHSTLQCFYAALSIPGLGLFGKIRIAPPWNSFFAANAVCLSPTSRRFGL